MSEFLGNLAARALGVSAVARPRPTIFEPRQAVSEPLALEPETVSVPQAGRAEDAPREPRGPKSTRPAREVESRLRRRTPSAETEADAQLVRALPAEPPAARTRARASPPPGERPANAQPVAEKAVPVLRSAPPQQRTKVPADPPGATTPSPRPSKVASEPSLAVRPSFPARVERATAEPTVRVTIGRIEVRAVKAEESPGPRKKPRQTPRISLDDYLGRTRERAR